jgi:hypothetical protein
METELLYETRALRTRRPPTETNSDNSATAVLREIAVALAGFLLLACAAHLVAGAFGVG